MQKIVLVGGNSQVASEVALYLSITPGIEVVPICRSAIGSAFLQHCGLPCRVADMSKPASAREAMAGADLVVDFSRPEGSAGSIKRRIEATLRNLVQHSPANCRVAFISTQMAFGIRMSDKDRRYRLIARTAYGATKRFGERLVRKLAATAHKEAYVLRLGGVHGELQGVSRHMRAIFKEESKVALPNTVSDTVFAFTIAEALAQIALGREKAGTYTLVSTPDWHWRDIYNYYCEQTGSHPELILYNAAQSRATSKWLSAAKAGVRSLLLQYRETIGAYVLSRFPETESNILAKYRLNNVARDVAAMEVVRPNPHCGPVNGEISGRRLTGLSDSRVTMENASQQVRSLLSHAVASLRDNVTAGD